MISWVTHLFEMLGTLLNHADRTHTSQCSPSQSHSVITHTHTPLILSKLHPCGVFNMSACHCGDGCYSKFNTAWFLWYALSCGLRRCLPVVVSPQAIIIVSKMMFEASVRSLTSGGQCPTMVVWNHLMNLLPSILTSSTCKTIDSFLPQVFLCISTL